MAYTPLTTQVAGGTASAAGWANVVKANFDAMGPHLIVRKPSDESVASSMTLQDDDHLQLPVAANEAWRVHYVLRMTIPLTPQLKMAFTFPSGGEIGIAGNEHDVGGTFGKQIFFGTTSPTSSKNFLGNTQNRFIELMGYYINGSTAGNLILQWCQDNINASAVVMKQHSSLWAVKLA